MFSSFYKNIHEISLNLFSQHPQPSQSYLFPRLKNQQIRIFPSSFPPHLQPSSNFITSHLTSSFLWNTSLYQLCFALKSSGQLYQLSFYINRMVNNRHLHINTLNLGIFPSISLNLMNQHCLKAYEFDYYQLDMVDFKNTIQILLICLFSNHIACHLTIKQHHSTVFPQSFKINLKSQMLKFNGSIILTLPSQNQNEENLSKVNCQPKCFVNGSKIQFPFVQFSKQLKFLTLHNLILPNSQLNSQIIVQTLSNTKNVVDSWVEKIKLKNHIQAIQNCFLSFTSHSNQEYSPKIKLISKDMKPSIIFFKFPSVYTQKISALYHNSGCQALANGISAIQCSYDKVTNAIKVLVDKQYSGQLFVQLHVKLKLQIINQITGIELTVFDKQGANLIQEMLCQRQVEKVHVDGSSQTRLRQVNYNGQPYLQVQYSSGMWDYSSTQTLVFTLSGYPVYNPYSPTTSFQLNFPIGYSSIPSSYCEVNQQISCNINFQSYQNQIQIIGYSELPSQMTITVYNIINPSSYPNGYFQTSWYLYAFVISSNMIAYPTYPTNCVFPCLSCNQSTQCTSCYTGYYFYNNQCISSCPQGTYIDYSNFSCFNTYCPLGTYPDNRNFTCAICNCYSCNQCSQSGDFCYSCNQNYYLQNGACYYCNVSCYNCISSTICLQCQFGNQDGDQCITFCPSGSFQANNSYECLACSQNCAYCNNQTQCYFCNQGYYLKTTIYQASCYSCPKYCSNCLNNGTCYSCFPGHYSIAGNCYPCGSGIIYGSSCTSVIIPFPFTIMSFIIIILTVVSYFSKKNTLAFVMYFSLNSLIQTISCVTLIGITVTYSGSTASLVLICLGFGIGFILSVAMSVFGVIKLPQDSYYTEWKDKNKVVYYICIAFSLLLNGRFFFFQFSRAFNAQSLNAVLSTKTNFKILRFILMATLVTALLVVIGCLFGIIQTPRQVSVIGNPVWDIELDCLIVHVIGMTALIIYIISSGKDSFETSPNPMDTERSQQTEMSSPFEVSQMQSPKYVQAPHQTTQSPSGNAGYPRYQQGVQTPKVGGGSIVQNLSSPVVLNNTGK